MTSGKNTKSQQQSSTGLNSDIDRRRITYRLEYPIEEEDVQPTTPTTHSKPETYSEIRNKILKFKIENKTIEGTCFYGCNFYSQKKAKQQRIVHLTFRHCIFHRCMLGSTDYVNVRFEDCEFEDCDFMNSKFIGCIFENSSFKKITASKTAFDDTEIDPCAFFAGVQFPERNYDDSLEPEKKKANSEFLESKRRLSGQIFQSNADVLNAENVDASLFFHKSIKCQQQKQLLLSKNWFLSIPGWVRWSLAQLNLLLTRGGTSLKRLALALLLACLVCPLLFHLFDIHFKDAPLKYGEDSASLIGIFIYWITNIHYSLPLCLGFGFTDYSAPHAPGTFFLIVAATLSFAWIALLIPVLIRRVYR